MSTHSTNSRRHNDVHFQVWLERRALATIGLYMDEQEIPFNALVHILRFSIETTVSLIERAGGTIIQDTETASKYLSTRVNTNLNSEGRGKAALAKNLLIDAGIASPPAAKEIIPDNPSAIESITPTVTPEELSAMKESILTNCPDIANERAKKDSKALKDIQSVFSKRPDEQDEYYGEEEV